MEILLKKGESLFREGDLGTLWRVEQGVILLHKTTDEGTSLTHMAMPGDIVGLESLCNRPYASTAVALIQTRLSQQVLSDDFCDFTVMAEGYMQQQQRMHDMLKLRTGPVASRLKCLVQMLARGKDGEHRKLDRKDLPSLREMSRLIDIAGETICRELKALFPQSKRTAASDASGNVPFAMAA